VAFQILNDLGDWEGDDHNKLAAGLDALGGRPTVLLALALEGLDAASQEELLTLLSAASTNDAAERNRRINRVRELYQQAGVFVKAQRLVDKHQERCEAIADELQPEELRRLLYYLIDSVLDRPAAESPVPAAKPQAALVQLTS